MVLTGPSACGGRHRHLRLLDIVRPCVVARLHVGQEHKSLDGSDDGRNFHDGGTMGEMEAWNGLWETRRR